MARVRVLIASERAIPPPALLAFRRSALRSGDTPAAPSWVTSTERNALYSGLSLTSAASAEGRGVPLLVSLWRCSLAIAGLSAEEDVSRQRLRNRPAVYAPRFPASRMASGAPDLAGLPPAGVALARRRLKGASTSAWRWRSRRERARISDAQRGRSCWQYATRAPPGNPGTLLGVDAFFVESM